MRTSRPFHEGQAVLWTRTEQGMPAHRRAQFIGYTPGGGAVVSYGFTAEGDPRKFTVGLGELSPERGPQPDGLAFLPGGRIQVLEPAKPLSPDKLATMLEQRRHTLRDALAAVTTASAAHTQAQEVYQRAQHEYEQARSMLLVLDNHHRQNLQNLTDALRDDRPIPEPLNGLDRDAVVIRAQLSEKALQRFRSELATAASHLGEAQSMVRDAAKLVVAALIDEQCETLRATLAEVLETRRRLISLSSWWPDSAGAIKLAPASVEILTGAIDLGTPGVAGLDTDAPREWKALLDRLMTDADAQFENVPAVEVAAA